jgi:integrase/recombinase XerD
MPIEPLEPVELATVKQMLSVCEHGSLVGERDRAILLALLDTGARAGELLNMNLEDLNYATGEIIIRCGKGRKPRVVFLGKKSRRALRAYLKTRRNEEPALWVTKFGTRLSYDGLRAVITHRAKLAEVESPQLHDFRRAFALNFLRNNPGEIFALQRLMGHADLQVLRRYLAQTEQDLLEAHRRGSPVDNSVL